MRNVRIVRMTSDICIVGPSVYKIAAKQLEKVVQTLSPLYISDMTLNYFSAYIKICLSSSLQVFYAQKI